MWWACFFLAPFSSPAPKNLIMSDSFGSDPTRRDAAGDNASDDIDFGTTIKGGTPGQRVFDRSTLTRILGRRRMGEVAAVVLGGVGWWFGVEQPKRDAAAAARDRVIVFLPTKSHEKD